MAELTGILQNPATIEQALENIGDSTAQQQSGQANQPSESTTVADITTLSAEGIELSQAAQTVPQVEEQGGVEQQQAEQPGAEAEEFAARFLDIRV